MFFFHLASVNQFDAPFYTVTTESQNNRNWPEQDSSLSQRILLIMEAHSIVFLQQSDYDVPYF